MRTYAVVFDRKTYTYTIMFRDDFDTMWTAYLDLKDKEQALEITEALNKENK